MQPRSCLLPTKSDIAGKRDLGVEARHADDDRGAAAARHLVRLQDRLGQADHLERVVGAATAGERPHLLDRVAVGRIDRGRSRRTARRSCASSPPGRSRRCATRPRCARPGAPTGRHRRSRSRRRSSPGSICAVLSAAPTPVVTPQPMSASCSAGRSVSTFTSIDSSTVISSANVPSPVMPITLLPSGRVPFDTIECAPICSQSCDWSRRHQKQLPHAGTNDAMTRSPDRDPRHVGADRRARCRRPRGRGSAAAARARCLAPCSRSEWQTPLASMCTSTSRGPMADARDLFDHQRLVVRGEDGCSHVPPGSSCRTIASRVSDSNRRHLLYKRSALPPELTRRRRQRTSVIRCGASCFGGSRVPRR